MSSGVPLVALDVVQDMSSTGLQAVVLDPLQKNVFGLSGSENDPLEAFEEQQLFIMFVMQHGGTDLESHQLRGFEEAQSILMQVCCPCCMQCQGSKGLDTPIGRHLT